jgi:prepilin-type processing-associated H-X9-DG protein
MQYTQDYDERMPSRQFGEGEAYPDNNWINVLQPYVKSYQLFRCPSNTRNNDNLRNDEVSGAQSKISYAPNTEGANSGGIFGSNGFNSISIAAINNPATTLAVVEGNGEWSDFVVTAGHFANAGNCAGRPCLSSHHPSTGNYLFADGHVKAMRATQTLVPLNMWRRENTNYGGSELTNAQNIVQQSVNFYK